jgi:nucleoside-triphosphatase THEP1
MLALVTGSIGAGKTTVCQRTLDLLRVKDLAPAGVLTPARLDASGAKIGIDVQDAASGAQRRFATRVASGGATIGEYTFDPEGLAWALNLLEEAVVAKPDLLVIDEIGPLELEHKRGFAVMLEPLADPARVPLGLVVVRAQYVEELTQRLARNDLQRFGVDAERRDGVPAALAKALIAAA